MIRLQCVQIPNFALAAPTLLLACAAIHCYVKQDPARTLFLGNLGPAKFRARVASRITGEKRSCATHDTHAAYPVDATSAMSGAHTHDSADSGSFAGASRRQSEAATGFLADGSFVFVAQLAAMALFAALFMHIQARFLPRFLPLFCVLLSHSTAPVTQHNTSQHSTAPRLSLNSNNVRGLCR